MDTTHSHLQLKESGIRTAILPVGSIEQHSHHLPLGTDTIIANEMSRRISANLTEMGHPNYLLPAISIATSLEHKGFVGTVTLRPPTLGLVIKDAVRSLYENDFQYVMLLNFHGGNFILKPTVREINYDRADRKVIYYDGGAAPGEAVHEIFETPEMHSGEAETSMILAINPDWVGDDRLDFVPKEPRSDLDMVSMKKLTPRGIWGHASKATAEKGEQYMELESRYAALFLLDWVKRLETDTSY